VRRRGADGFGFRLPIPRVSVFNGAGACQP
jgi:hypothetical protein